jgi:hypothetical protein
MIGILFWSQLLLNQASASVSSEIAMRIDSEVNALDSAEDSKLEESKLEEPKSEEVDWEWNRFCLRLQLDAGLVIPGFVSVTIVPEIEFVFERD